MLFGGSSGANETWEWDGNDWTQRQPVASPPGRSATGMAFDPINRRPVLFGGITLPGGRYDETWGFLAASALFQIYGGGCAGTAGVPSLAAGSPWLGQPWTLRLSNLPATAPVVVFIGSSDTSWSGLPLPFSLAALGMPGCSLHASGQVMVATTASGGQASLGLPIPNGVSLQGASVFLQGLVVDPGANAAGLVVSSAGRGTLAGL